MGDRSLLILIIFSVFIFIFSNLGFAELMAPEIWNKKIWMEKQKENPLSNMKACLKYFPKVNKSVSYDDPPCSPADGSYIFMDKGKKKKVAIIHYSSGCGQPPSYGYYKVNNSGKQIHVERKEFCEHITGYNSNCKKCLE